MFHKNLKMTYSAIKSGIKEIQDSRIQGILFNRHLHQRRYLLASGMTVSEGFLAGFFAFFASGIGSLVGRTAKMKEMIANMFLLWVSNLKVVNYFIRIWIQMLTSLNVVCS